MYFVFNDTATTEIYTLSLHDALPIFVGELQGIDDPQELLEVASRGGRIGDGQAHLLARVDHEDRAHGERSEEHTSELQSRQYLVCRLLLEKKKISVPPWCANYSHLLI